MNYVRFAFLVAAVAAVNSWAEEKSPEPTPLVREYLSCLYDGMNGINRDDPEKMTKLPMYQWEAKSNCKVVYANKRFLSWIVTEFEYVGGAHGSWRVTVGSIFVPTGKRIALPALYENSAEKEELQTALRRAAAQYAKEHELSFDKRELSLTENFYLDGTSIHFVYNPYEIAGYAAGVIEIIVPWTHGVLAVDRNVELPNKTAN